MCLCWISAKALKPTHLAAQRRSGTKLPASFVPSSALAAPPHKSIFLLPEGRWVFWSGTMEKTKTPFASDGLQGTQAGSPKICNTVESDETPAASSTSRFPNNLMENEFSSDTRDCANANSFVCCRKDLWCLTKFVILAAFMKHNIKTNDVRETGFLQLKSFFIFFNKPRKTP